MQTLCNECSKYKPEAEVKFGVCDDCYKFGAMRIAPPDHGQRTVEPIPNIILTTSIDVPGRQIESVISIVAVEVALTLHVFKDIASAFRDMFGGRSKTSQAALKEARLAALDQLKREAKEVGADAVIAVDLDYNELSTIGSGGGGILLVVANGTAVKLAPAL
ncbi:YbjQ family protein [Rhizobium leguminosarum]|uniref:YbjQ family protein n=1 Tax=Rhizobium leguminosarum TaxID=384 RepID=UPI003F99FB3F